MRGRESEVTKGMCMAQKDSMGRLKAITTVRRLEVQDTYLLSLSLGSEQYNSWLDNFVATYTYPHLLIFWSASPVILDLQILESQLNLTVKTTNLNN